MIFNVKKFTLPGQMSYTSTHFLLLIGIFQLYLHVFW